MGILVFERNKDRLRYLSYGAETVYRAGQEIITVSRALEIYKLNVTMTF